MPAFDAIFNFTYKIYLVLMTSGQLIWTWFSQPIDPSLAEFVGLDPSTLNVEMLFGSILIMSITMAAVKLFNPLS